MLDINNQLSAINWHREPYGLYEPIEYTLSGGGKRVRPTLTFIASDMFGGRDDEVLPAALALEVFHNFTLLHDDVMDHSDTRRGRQTVWTRWDENTAILSGDQMLIEAYKLLVGDPACGYQGVPESKLQRVMRDFSHMATEICEGQQYDVDFESRTDVTIDDYMLMIRLKTSVLLANALRTGAYIAGADEQQQQALYEFGIHIGLAFQIQDDILDVYGDPATFGKPIGGDILNNKKTYMLLTALRLAQDDDRDILQGWLAAPASNDKIAAVTSLYTRLGVRGVCEKVMNEHTRKAVALLANLPQNEATDALRTLADKLLNRNK